ncbi:MAG TPA: hypothetical protein VFS67_05350, partial [Polyangiaceae bacterium]|nr:hypothetical protein [Polyangiaceae bacterium]
MISTRSRFISLPSLQIVLTSGILGAGFLGAVSGMGCGSPPPREGLFYRRGGDARAGAAGEGGAGGEGGDAALPESTGGAAGQGAAGVGGAGAAGAAGAAASAGAGGTAEPGDAGPDAAGDAATADAGELDPLGCAPADRADCDLLRSALVHRYSFDGSGAAVLDSAGDAHGSVQDGQLSGTGELALDGDDQFVDLPNGIVSALQSATFEAWVDWAGGSRWQRIFDFGDSD